MKPIPEHHHSAGVCYHLQKREADIALYSLSYVCGGAVIGHDVGRVRVIDTPQTICGNEVPPHECFPVNADYGRSWWSYSSRETAEGKFKELLKAGSNP